MKKLLLALLASSSSLVALKAQTRVIDSLKQVLKTQKDDTNKVNTLNTLSAKLGQISMYDSTMACANSAQALAVALSFKKGIAVAFRNIGSVYFQKGNYPQALEYDFKALAIYRETGNKNSIAKTLTTIGNVYNEQGNYSQALEYFFKALAINEETGNKYNIADNLGNIGAVYDEQGNYSQALEYDFKAVAIDKETGDKTSIAIDLGNIGIIYEEQGNYSQALEYYFKALAIKEETGFKSGIANTLINIGNVYNEQGNYSQALEYYFKSLTIHEEIGNKKGIAIDLYEIGESYTHLKNFKAAKAYLDSSLALSKNSGFKEELRDCYSGLAKLDSARGNYQKALEDYKNFIVYKDSLINEAEIKKSTQAEMNYDFSRKTDSTKAVQDKKDAVAASEKQKQMVLRNSLVGGFSITFLAAGIFFVQRRRIAKEKKRSDELLLNILPEETAEELKATGTAKAKSFALVTVMFTDFKDFTAISEKLSPEELVAELHTIFQGFDNIINTHGIEKIKTIGDSYMAAGGLPVANQTHAKDVVSAALEIQQFMAKHNGKRASENKPVFEARIGINTGPVVAGIVGIKKFSYDIWGDTVNLASRMESSGESGKVNISGSTYLLVKNDFTCTHRGKIQAKNKGEVDMYFVSGQ